MTFTAPKKSTLQKAFEQTILNSKSRDSLNLSDSEVKQLGNAFEDDQFTTLLSDYIQEISDPKNRAEKDLYLKQLEEQNDVPVNKTVIHPKAGYVLKFKSKDGEKIFVNIVHSEEIAKPSSHVIEGKRGSHWILPYIIGPMRYEFDKRKKEMITFDICFHSFTLELGKSSNDFRDLIVGTAKDAVGEQLSRNVENIEIGTDIHVLKNVLYMNGSPSIMLLPSNQLNKTSNRNNGNETLNMKESTIETQLSNQFGFKKGFLLGKKKRNKIDSLPTSNLTSSKAIIPHFEVIERGNFDLIDHTIDGPKHKSTRPAFVEYRISLPTIKSSNQVDLKVNKQRIELSTSPKCIECTAYSLNIPLRYPVLSEEGTAKFDTSLSKLVITLPVERQEKNTQVDNHNDNTKQLLVEVENTNCETDSCKTNNSDHQSNNSEMTCYDGHSRWLESNVVDCKTHREHFASKKRIPLKLNKDESEKLNEPDENKEGEECLNDVELNEMEKVECSNISRSIVGEDSLIFSEEPPDSKERMSEISEIVFELD